MLELFTRDAFITAHITLRRVRKWMKTKSSVLVSTSSAASPLNKITKMICFQII